MDCKQKIPVFHWTYWFNIKFVFTLFGRGHRLFLSWARWIQTVSRIAWQYIGVSWWNRNLTLVVLKKKNLYCVTYYMWSTACNGIFHPSVNQIFVSFLCVWNVTSYIEEITCFVGLREQNYQGNIWPLEGVNIRRTENYVLQFFIGSVHNVNVIGSMKMK